MFDAVRASWTQDPTLRGIIHQIQSGVIRKPHYHYQSGIVSGRGKMLTGANSELIKRLTAFYHDSPIVDHSVIATTPNRLAKIFTGKRWNMSIPM